MPGLDYLQLSISGRREAASLSGDYVVTQARKNKGQGFRARFTRSSTLAFILSRLRRSDFN
jgi:hypothetical protein